MTGPEDDDTRELVRRFRVWSHASWDARGRGTSLCNRVQGEPDGFPCVRDTGHKGDCLPAGD